MLHALAAFKGGDIQSFWEGGRALYGGGIAFYGGTYFFLYIKLWKNHI